MIACPSCKSLKSKVVNSGRNQEKDRIERQRRCESCSELFYTREMVFKKPKPQPKPKATPSIRKKGRKRFTSRGKRILKPIDINQMTDEELEQAIHSGEVDFG